MPSHRVFTFYTKLRNLLNKLTFEVYRVFYFYVLAIDSKRRVSDKGVFDLIVLRRKKER